jgi:DNA-binding Xre family transcriptional regulator
MGYRIDLDKHSVHDWLKNKNEMKFSKLEEICKKLNINIKIVIEE